MMPVLQVSHDTFIEEVKSRGITEVRTTMETQLLKAISGDDKIPAQPFTLVEVIVTALDRKEELIIRTTAASYKEMSIMKDAKIKKHNEMLVNWNEYEKQLKDAGLTVKEGIYLQE